MDDDAHEERFRQHEEIMNGLYAMLVRQEEMNQRQEGINERLTTAIEGLETTQAQIATLLTRMLRPEDNGPDI
jgi:hypothetical protein